MPTKRLFKCTKISDLKQKKKYLILKKKKKKKKKKIKNNFFLKKKKKKKKANALLFQIRNLEILRSIYFAIFDSYF